MTFKRTISTILAYLIITSYVPTVSATDKITPEKADGLPDLAVQLNDLYYDVGNELHIDYMYVKILHILAGGKAVYADKRPNIYSEETVKNIDAPFALSGATELYNKSANWVYCPDQTINRPSAYYIPDAAYNVTSSIVNIMNIRARHNRGAMQPYFDTLKKDVKTNILFCEAVMEYTGMGRESIDNFHIIYEKILYEKGKYENVLENNGDGTFTFKEKFKNIFTSNGIFDLDKIAIILSFDKNLAASNNPDELKDSIVTPYKLGYKSRENTMLAAMSLVGKVRYVWGGGHLGTASIKGINPIWERFNSTYTDEIKTEDNCIKPYGSNCPIHKTMSDANGCLLSSNVVYSVEQYLDSRNTVFDTGDLRDQKYIDLLSGIGNLDKGMISHRLDGLDCSGYTNWIFNQIDDSIVYDFSALTFIDYSKFDVIDYREDLLPCDVVSWGDHIVLVVGKVDNLSDAYVILEASPNVVKFGGLIYNRTRESSIVSLKNICDEANSLLGNLDSSEKAHIYNMDKLGLTEMVQGYDTGGNRCIQAGRLSGYYIDENTIISEIGKPFKMMTARDIIQHTVNKLTNGYALGAKEYTGEIFTKENIKIIREDNTVKQEKLLYKHSNLIVGQAGTNNE